MVSGFKKISKKNCNFLNKLIVVLQKAKRLLARKNFLSRERMLVKKFSFTDMIIGS
ncbi:MAG: hypothetical protein [Microvirus sp.]|nr:MAG: hypothetical protein [Microvirus sp.]